MYRVTSPVLRTAAVFALLAIVPAAIVVMRLKTARLSGDGPSYMDIAQSVASGKGFQEPHFLWPGRPTARRPPLWPLVLSAPLRIWCGSDPIAVMCWTEIVLHAATAFGAAVLAWMLSGSRIRMLAAALLVACWPGTIPYMVAGLSEPCSAAFLTTGTVLVCMGRRWFFPGVFLLSMVPLARPNFLLVPVSVAAILAVLHVSRRLDMPRFGAPRVLAAAAALFFIPTGAWLIRNYAVTGAFPVLLTKAGEDLWGTYNPAAAATGPFFARWVMPDKIPGEERIDSLAATRSEYELSRYYQAKGLRFIGGHWRALPMLMAGRILFAAAPQWPAFGDTPTGARHSTAYRKVEWTARVSLYAAALVFLLRRRLNLRSWYALLFASVALTTAATVLLFWGSERFLYQLTVMAAPFVCSAAGGGNREADPAAASTVESGTPAAAGSWR